MKNRPVGTYFLAAFLILCGILNILLPVSSHISLGVEIGVNRILVLIFEGFLLGVVSGVGILIGKRWAWWLSAYSLIYYETGVPYAIHKIHSTTPSTVQDYLVVFGPLFVIYFCFLIYIYRTKTMSYFGLGNVNKMNAFSITFFAAAATSGLLILL